MSSIKPTSCTRIPISVVVPAKNEEANLSNCLARLSVFSEVIVVDSSSTDKTKEITEAYAATYINFEWDGRYPKKRNWFLMNHQIKNNWVLFLDADENVTDNFCEEVAEAIENDAHQGYWLNYTNYFMGRPLKFGVGQKKLALFRKDCGLYEYIEEDNWSALDMEIHEHPIINGSVGTIKNSIDHNDYRGIEKFIDRHKNYAMWEAHRYELIYSNEAAVHQNLTKRQKIKYRWFSRWWYPWAYFIYAYLIKFGILDGKAGFIYAYYKFWYFFTIQILINERSKSIQ